jgi:hypothetical protein
MKLISLIATGILLATSSSFAANLCSLTWDQIYAKHYRAEMPKVQFGSVFVSIDGVCVNGDTVETTSAVEVCTDYSRNEHGGCSATKSITLSKPIKYMREISVGEHGGKFEKIPQTLPLSYSVPVGREVERGLQVVCQKTYTLPACK